MSSKSSGSKENVWQFDSTANTTANKRKSVLSRIKETPIWESHLASSTSSLEENVEKRASVSSHKSQQSQNSSPSPRTSIETTDSASKSNSSNRNSRDSLKLNFNSRRQRQRSVSESESDNIWMTPSEEITPKSINITSPSSPMGYLNKWFDTNNNSSNRSSGSTDIIDISPGVVNEKRRTFGSGGPRYSTEGVFTSNNNDDVSRRCSLPPTYCKGSSKGLIFTNAEFSGISRTPVSSSMLVIGLVSSGKSSLINTLLDQKVAEIGNRGCTKEIMEYTAKIKVPESFSGFYNLRIIDTPGFTNERNGESDARLMTSLMSFLESKDGLKGKPPTLVLVVARFDDKKITGENTNFVNFLKVLEQFKKHFNNTKIPNFIFVFTHFLNVEKDLQSYPTLKLQAIKSLIDKYTTLKEPIPLHIAENQSAIKGLVRVGQFFQLPNGELFPGSIIDEMKIILTRKGRDSLSETILLTAFGVQYPQSINMQDMKAIPLLQADHPTVQNTRKILNQIYANIEHTEISQLLELGWENLSKELRNKYPSSLIAVQRILQRHGIKAFDQLPDDTFEILQLISEIPQNSAVADLLIETLQLKVPICASCKPIGQGYDLSRDTPTTTSPFQFNNNMTFKTSPVGQIPNEIDCDMLDERVIVFKFYYSYDEYIMDRLRDLNVRHIVLPSNIMLPRSSSASLFQSEFKKPGYNIIKPNQTASKNDSATALIEYRLFQLTLADITELEFKEDFLSTLKSLPHMDEKIPTTLLAWKQFFTIWGTHVIESAYFGGAVHVNFRGKILSNIFNTCTRTNSTSSTTDILDDDYEGPHHVFEWITGDGLEFVASRSTSKSDFLQSSDLDSCFKGGDEEFDDIDVTKLPTYEEVKEIRRDWKESLLLNPVMLKSTLVLVPLSLYVHHKDEELAKKIDTAFQIVFSQFITSDGKNSSCNIL